MPTRAERRVNHAAAITAPDETFAGTSRGKTFAMTRLIVFSLLVTWALTDAILTAKEMPTFGLKLWGFFGSLSLSLVFIGAAAFAWDWIANRFHRPNAG